MHNIHVVTDSCAHFANIHFVQQFPITIVPNRIEIAGKNYLEGEDITSEEALNLIERERTPPIVTSPSEEEFFELYQRLARGYSAIISIHPSRELFPSWYHARAAAQQLLGHVEIAVIDSRTISAGQASLARTAIKARDDEGTIDDLIRKVRGAVERVYSVYYVETIDYLLQNNIMSEPHAILGTMLGIKPILAIDDGVLKPIEKVRTRTQGIDRLVEFVTEFTDIEEAVILQHKAFMSDQTRLLQDRLAVEFPGHYFPYTMYGPSLAALIGPEATGLVILEQEAKDYRHGS